MTPEQQQEYDDYVSLFATDGWRRYIKNLGETREATLQAAPENAHNNDTWQYARGLLSQMDQTIHFEPYVLSVYEQVQADLEDEAEDE